jgi:predicted Zn-dependent protease
MVLAWVGPEDAGGIGMHNLEKEPVTLNLIPTRYESDERWQSVLLHEAGHVFGMAHNTKDRHAVMWPSNDTRKTCLKQPDLTSFCSVNVCDGRKMFPCE